jgi:hypothetical protein
VTDEQIKAFWQIAGQAEDLKRQAAHLRDEADNLIDHTAIGPIRPMILGLLPIAYRVTAWRCVFLAILGRLLLDLEVCHAYSTHPACSEQCLDS